MFYQGSTDIFGPKTQDVNSKGLVTVFGGLVKGTLAGDRFVMMKANVVCVVKAL